MSDHEEQEIINETAATTAECLIKELQRQGMIRQRETAYQRTEKALSNYRLLRSAVNEAEDKQRVATTERFLTLIDNALDEIKDDPYYQVIKMIYIEGKTRESVADILFCDVKTITRNKKRLIDILKVRLFTDMYIKELIFDM